MANQTPATDPLQAKRRLLESLLTPVIAFCLRRGLAIYDFEHVAKRIFVRLAAAELQATVGKVNTSRVSVLTGLYRRDVDRILQEKPSDSDKRQTVLSKVIGTWENSSRYCTRAGGPRVLTADGDASEFFKLVESVTRHTHPSAVLFEIQRNGAAVLTNRGLKLIRRTVVLSGDEVRSFDFVGRDIDLMVKACEENLSQADAIGNLQHRTEYDNVYVSDIPRIKAWIADQGIAFHKRVRDYVSSFDRDITPKKTKTEPAGAKVLVSSFSFTELPRTPQPTVDASSG